MQNVSQQGILLLSNLQKDIEKIGTFVSRVLRPLSSAVVKIDRKCIDVGEDASVVVDGLGSGKFDVQ